MPAPRPRTLLAAALLVATAGALTGCAAVTTTTKATFASRGAAEQGWPYPIPVPSWIPAEVRTIHTGGRDGTSDVIVYADTSAPLPEGVCLEAARTTTPTVTTPWAPKWPAPPETVWVCDGWEIAPFANGWFGWTTART